MSKPGGILGQAGPLMLGRGGATVLGPPISPQLYERVPGARPPAGLRVQYLRNARLELWPSRPGHDSVREGKFHTVYQYTEPELAAAVKEAARLGKHVAVHATGEPGTLYAAQAGVASIDHANQLGDETMRLMREKQIFAVPTFTIFEYFGDHAATPEQSARERQMLDLHAQEFKKQTAAGVPMALGSDVGPFPHGTQAREFALMVKFGMSPLAVLQADLLNGAKFLEWQPASKTPTRTKTISGHLCLSQDVSAIDLINLQLLPALARTGQR